MSNIQRYSSKATALRGLTRYLGVAARNNPDLDLKTLVHYDGDANQFYFEQEAADAAVKLDVANEEDENLILTCGHSHCPHCGIHLNNGLMDFDSLSDQHGGDKAAFKLQKHEWSCMGCNGEWGAEIQVKGANASSAPVRHYTNKSTVEGAVALCHSIYSANPGARRKDAIKLAEDAGVAFYTARTQYQKWFKGKKKA